MKTLEDVLEMMAAHIDRPMVEEYIRREWLRPIPAETGWHFEEIDIARLQLVYHLSQEIKVNDDGMDVVLSLLDQLYGLRADMLKLVEAVVQQPLPVQTEILLKIKRSQREKNDLPDLKS